MAGRFVFTTRDWFWLCLVFFLAIGWARHYRYSQLAIINARREWKIVPDDQVRRELDWNRDQVGRLTAEIQSLNNALRQTLNEEQRENVEKKAREYRQPAMEGR
jgi:hypothetical protein